MNPSEKEIKALVEAQARGEIIADANVEAGAPAEAELDLRVSKFSPPAGMTSSDTITDQAISSAVVLAHE